MVEIVPIGLAWAVEDARAVRVEIRGVDGDRDDAKLGDGSLQSALV